jgi:hypothetical protein
MPQVEFESMTPVSEREKPDHALNGAATVTGSNTCGDGKTKISEKWEID